MLYIVPEPHTVPAGRSPRDSEAYTGPTVWSPDLQIARATFLLGHHSVHLRVPPAGLHHRLIL